MQYIEELELYQIINIFAFLIGLVYGGVAQKTQFCFNGAIKDYVLTKSTTRASSILIAMITAILMSQLVSYIYQIDFSQTVYLRSNVNYISIIFGGILFGIGMTLADGCGSRHLIKISQGNLHSFIALLFIALFAYITSQGILSYISTLLTRNEFFLSISALVSNQALSIMVVIPLLLLALYKLVPTLKNLLLSIDGLIIGLLIGSAWFVTGVIGLNEFEPVKLEGLSFVFPSGETLEYFMYFNGNSLSFSVSIIFGILAGGFLISLFNTKDKVTCTSQEKNNKLKSAITGGSLMGIGGILAIGCTVGQGLSGISTLAFASFIAIISIGISAYCTTVYIAKKDALSSRSSLDWTI